MGLYLYAKARFWCDFGFQTKLDCGIICNFSSEFLNKDLVNVSNQVGLWYNLQQNIYIGFIDQKPFQTKLDCGIICNSDFTRVKLANERVSNQVGLWYNLQLTFKKNLQQLKSLFQTKLDCGIICNVMDTQAKQHLQACFKPSWIVV